MSTATATEIRWMIQRDMPEILSIEEEAFGIHAWSHSQFIANLRSRNCIGMVATVHEQVVGYMVYDLLKDGLHVQNFAIQAEYRRQGIGTALVDKLKGKLGTRRSYISLAVSEKNLRAHFFWRAMGFKAVRVIRDFYDDVDEDAYWFRYKIDS